ncbi:transporter substrate-binding domain-containing protein [Mobiluncus curtisii]|uniref:transporter substrate-binding domain-containing protein n=1 Tax=Mobiluncus curtisii TaxID=2051 RepID=UPI00242C3268|nr:transporter substrate-binding domain-containing protein [Mobiluncus curtisii]
MRRLSVAMLLAAASLGLAGCSTASTGNAGGDDANIPQPSAAPTFDFSTIKPDPKVEAMVPAEVKERGVLRNGASTSYAPAEFLLDDGTTPTGYEVDMVKAIALTMGLDDGTTTTEAFGALLPKIGTTYDLGASSFTVTPERVANYDMLAYMDMGSLFAVAKGNPQGFDPKDICGKTVGVQTGTLQETELLPKLSKQCEASGKPPVDIQKEELLSNVFPKVISGQYQAMLADDPVTSYYVKQTRGQMEQIGQILDPSPIGIVVDNKNQQLSAAIKAAMDSLLASGKMREIMDNYGAGAGLYDAVELKTSVAK